MLAPAVAGVWLRRRDIGRDAILWGVVVTFVAAHVMYFPTTRYRVPMEFVLPSYAAVALDSAMPRGWRWTRALPDTRWGVFQ